MHTDKSLKPLLPLTVRSVSYAIKSKNLLHDINLDISNKNISVILGHNGVGKSLLVRLLHGLLKTDKGCIHWNHQSGTELNVRLRQSMVFQNTVLLRRSAAANIDYVLKLRRITDKARRNKLLSQAGLAEHASQPARSLSGGEQQRLAIARALACEPEVLFLDEPTASLDPAATSQIEQQIRDASQHSIKIIMITHDIAQARRLADDVIFMQNGRISEHTSAAQFFNRPESEAARDYLNAYLTPNYGSPLP